MAGFMETIKVICENAGMTNQESQSEARIAVWEADEDVPPEVRLWLQQLIHRRFQTMARRQRREGARRSQVDVVEVEDHKTVAVPYRQQRNPVTEAIAHELRTALAQDPFDEQLVTALLHEHPNSEDGAEFAKQQSDFSKAHCYKRQEKIRQRLRSLVRSS